MRGSNRSVIGIDCRFAATHSGIGRYTRELVQQLLKRNDPWQYVLFAGETTGPLITGKNAIHHPLRAPHYSLSEQCELPGAIRAAHIDLMHFLHFSVPWHCPVPYVVTIHDLILHQFPNQAALPKRIAYRTLMKHAIRNAAHIIAVSNHTADEIARTYGSTEPVQSTVEGSATGGDNIRKKMCVIHEGVSPQFQPQEETEQKRVKEKYALFDDFVLSVGSAKEHKNVQTLIDACPTERQLVLVTGGKEVAGLKPTTNTAILTNVDDRDLPALYSAAALYVHPSLAEGFCLPILEAMACGCRVVASNRGSIPEIAGGHAILVEPTREHLAKGVISALENPRSTLRRRPPQRRSEQAISNQQSITHAQSFSWEGMAEATARVYARILGSHFDPPPDRPQKARPEGPGRRLAHRPRGAALAQ